MRRVRRRSFLGRVSRGERGAVGTILAVLLLGGVVMGMLALSVDVGNIWSERRQLQNGADATSLALADACAKGTAGCSADPALNNLQPLAGENAIDKLAQLDAGQLCGHGSTRFPLSGLPPCTDTGSFQQLTKCNPVPSWLLGQDIPYVETRPSTLGQGNSTILPKYFSQLLVGGAGPNVTESACARAAWGPAGNTGNTLPISIGACDWANDTAVDGVPGKRYAPSPPYDPPPGDSTTALPSNVTTPPPGYVYGIFTHSANKCVGMPGAAYPGGFSWLNSASCVANIGADGWVLGSTGNGNQCSATDLQKYVGTEVFIPITDQVVGTGSTASYHVSGVASFFFAGWDNFSTAAPTKTYSVYAEPATVCPPTTCNGASDQYIWGWFTSGEKPLDSSIIGTVDRGATQIVQAG